VGRPSITLDRQRAAGLRDDVCSFLTGERPLTGLELYYLLEAATSLREFHTMLRGGKQNLMRSGLQQSYGDHNRVLLLGLDRLTAGDVAWFRDRVTDGDVIDGDSLAACVAAVRALDLPADVCVALWLGAALHDCGMLGGRSMGVDVEDGVDLARDLVEELCPERTQSLALFAVRNHDYVKDMFRGEVPVQFIADQVDDLEPDLRPVAVATLGMIQVAGAASLGEGRLSSFRLTLFERCLAGTVFADASPAVRLQRLLGTGGESTTAPVVDALASSRAADWREFLDAVPTHGWHRAWGERRDDVDAKARVLEQVVPLWSETHVDHVVLARDAHLPDSAGTWEITYMIETLRNGTSAAFIH